MTTFTIEQAKGMVGMVLLRVEAKIKHLYPREQKTGPKGNWFQQKGYIVDSTGEMVIVFNDMEDQMRRVGQVTIFKSTAGSKGTHGVQVKSWQGKKGTNIELVISKTALVVAVDEEANVSTVTPSTRMPQTASDSPRNDPSNALVHEDRKLGIATAKNRLTQLAGLYDLCWETVGHMKVYEDTEGGMELHKDVATTLFIAAQREGLAEKMPVRTLSKFYNEGGQDHQEHEDQEHEKEDAQF